VLRFYAQKTEHVNKLAGGRRMAYWIDGEEQSYIKELQDFMSGELHFGDIADLKSHVDFLTGRVNSIQEFVDDVEEKQITCTEIATITNQFKEEIEFYKRFIKWANRIMSGYEIMCIEAFTEGDLKGYAQGRVHFHNTGCTHEFLYRIDDSENGENDTLVSIDHGYMNNRIDELWDEIETEIKKLLTRIESKT